MFLLKKNVVVFILGKLSNSPRSLCTLEMRLLPMQVFRGRRKEEAGPTCLVSVKVFGHELSVFTCQDLYEQVERLSLSVAGLAVKLLKVQQR